MASNASTVVSNVYDYMGRRVRKTVLTKRSDGWITASDSSFVYDGWSMLSEICHLPSEMRTNTSWFVWGLDLSGTIGGAGGIGGLLSILADDSSLLAPVYDGNGNVTALVDTNGSVVTAYEYDPFGNIASGISGAGISNPYRYSTKYHDQETGLAYYGYRFYSAGLGRWLSRDPMEEGGGVNLYGFVGNAPPNAVDGLGLAGYFFGGTGNHNFEKNLNGSGNMLSSVEIMFRAWDTSQNGRKYYVPGVFSGFTPEGNQYGRKWYLLGARGLLFEGAAGKSLGDRVNYMVGKLEKELRNGDKEVNIFGFSRGAASALEFLNRIRDKAGNNPLYSCIRINFVALWDTVDYTAGSYRTDLPTGLNYIHQPLHFIALDEQRSQFSNERVLNVEGALQIGFRGVHADVGGGYPNNPFELYSRLVAVENAQRAGLEFDVSTINTFSGRYGGWNEVPTDNDQWFYNGGERRTFPNDMYLHWSVEKFGRYSQPLNNIDSFVGGGRLYSPEVWK
jgi:RHS repeat-associated protein